MLMNLEDAVDMSIEGTEMALVLACAMRAALRCRDVAHRRFTPRLAADFRADSAGA